jgi:hypothetical protein
VKLRFADLLLPAAVTAAPATSLIISIFGHPTVVLDAFYNRVWQDDTRAGFLAAAITTVILLAVLIVVSLRQRFEIIEGKNLLSQHPLLFLSFSVLISLLSNYQSWGIFGIAKVLIFFWIAIAFFRSGLSFNSFRITALIVFSSYVLAIIYPLLFVQNAWKQCRDDKCNFVGSLLTSFFQSENALSLYVLSTLFFLKFLNNKRYRAIGYCLALLLTYLSGSRLGFITVAVVVALITFKKTKILAWAPLTFLASSFFIFIFGNGEDFTGRGSVFSAVREIWAASPLLGVGPNATQTAFERGLVIGFIPYNEQTESAHLLAHYGILGTLIFIAVVFILLRSRKAINQSDSLSSLATPFLITSLGFVTEASASFTLDCPSFWVVALLFAKISNTDEKDSLSLDRIKFQSANPYNRSPASPKPGTM